MDHILEATIIRARDVRGGWKTSSSNTVANLPRVRTHRGRLEK